ncbi:MAG TPA: hypothetical protein VLG50_02685 [Candidatus Saccharimonadales bacterium]|nr:hypothetical protein [Candidatus Saccharimonadales bacterium]
MFKKILFMSSLLLFCIAHNVYSIEETEVEKKVRWLIQSKEPCYCRHEEILLCNAASCTTICCIGAIAFKLSPLTPVLAMLSGACATVVAGTFDEMEKRDEFLQKQILIKKME